MLCTFYCTKKSEFEIYYNYSFGNMILVIERDLHLKKAYKKNPTTTSWVFAVRPGLEPGLF